MQASVSCSHLIVLILISLVFISAVEASSPSKNQRSAALTISTISNEQQQERALTFRTLSRCAGIRGSACSSYYAQTIEDLLVPPVLAKACPQHPGLGTPCGLGVCHGDTGVCDCPAGVGGVDCSKADLRPCTNRYRADRNSSSPASHIGPNKRDVNWRQPGWTPSRCAGVCDDATATCFCDGAHFGRVPALPGAPPGSPPIRPGRLLHGTCQRLTTDDAGRPLKWGEQGGMTYEDIYGAQGWCTVDKPRVSCSCDLDGYDGQLCEAVTETVCPNQCSGHGACIRGFCKCFTGWFGLDCARLADPAALNPAAAAAAAAAVDGAANGDSTLAAAAAASEAAGTGTASHTTAAGVPAGRRGSNSGGGGGGSHAVGGAGATAAGQEDAHHSTSSSSSSHVVESTVDSVASAEHERHQEQNPATGDEAAGTAADAAAAAADSAATQQPEHVRFMKDRPYLAQLVVDTWPAAQGTHSHHAVASVAPAAAAAARGAATPSSSAAAAGGGDGVLASSTAHPPPPPVPGLYFTPVSPEVQQGGRSGEGLGQVLLLNPAAQGRLGQDEMRRLRRNRNRRSSNRRRRIRKHARGLQEQQQQQERQQPEVVQQEQQQEQEEGCQQQQQQGPWSFLQSLLWSSRDHQHQQQQQQQRACGRTTRQQEQQEKHEQQQEKHEQQQQDQGLPPRFLRTLLRHYWTGGGSQRAELTLAPKQQTVTAAVHKWLSQQQQQQQQQVPPPSSSSEADLDGAADGTTTTTAAGVDFGTAGSGSRARASSSSSSKRRIDGAGLADALAAAGVQMGQLVGDHDMALLKHMVEMSMSDLPAGKVRRPRIFVYDMPSRFVSRLLQYRSSKQTCTWRVFSKSNYSLLTTTESKSAWQYPLESHLHELMLQSPHRTLDPQEADFFYVPVYAACMMEAVAGWADAPWWHQYSKSHVKQGVLMYQDALNWIRTTYPYWNASGGVDHIWLFAHDEGACWAPTEVYNASIILSQWGRLGAASHIGGYGSKHGPVMESWTSKWSQNWNKFHSSNQDPVGLPGGQDYNQLLTHHSCYTPGKDLVLPAFRPPPLFRASPYLGGDSRRERDILVLLRGDMGKGRPAAFSQGVRQGLAELAAEGDWRRRHNAWIGTPNELPGEQTALLARSRYCLVVPLDGWSGTFEDAVLHGCIPVVVNLGEGLAQPFSALLRLSSGVLNVAVSDLPNLPDILKAIPPAEEDALRAALGTWWHRMAWLTHPFVRSLATNVVHSNAQRYPRVRYDLEQQRAEQAQALASMGRPPEAPKPPVEVDDSLLIPVIPVRAVSEAEDIQDATADGDDNGTADDAAAGGTEAQIIGGADAYGGSGSGAAATSSSSGLREADDDGGGGTSQSNNSSSDGSVEAAAVSGGGTTAAADDVVVPPPTTTTSVEEQVAELFRPRVWQPDAPVDDAFTTLMQWLYLKLQRRYDPSRSPPS